MMKEGREEGKDLVVRFIMTDSIIVNMRSLKSVPNSILQKPKLFNH